MADNVLDQLLTTLRVRLHAFAVCEIQEGYRLGFDPMEAVTIHYVLSGDGVLRTGTGASVPFGPHTIVVVPARTRQSIGDAGPLGAEVAAGDEVGVLGDGLLRFTAGSGSPSTRILCGMILATYGGAFGLFDNLDAPLVATASNAVQLRYAFEEMIEELARPAIGTRALTESLMKQCLVLLLRQELARQDPALPFFSALQDRRLARAIAAILERPAERHTIEDLATLSGMSRSSFTERFLAAFGQSPIDFVQRVRLRLAAHLLATTELPVKLVASSVGYASRSYFSRVFRDAYGQDPASFRSRGVSPEDEAWAGVPLPLAPERA